MEAQIVTKSGNPQATRIEFFKSGFYKKKGFFSTQNRLHRIGHLSLKTGLDSNRLLHKPVFKFIKKPDRILIRLCTPLTRSKTIGVMF